MSESPWEVTLAAQLAGRVGIPSLTIRGSRPTELRLPEPWHDEDLIDLIAALARRDPTRRS